MEYWYLIAGASLSFAGMIFHGYFGGRIYKRNIFKSDLEPLTKSLSLVSWHVFTVFLFVSASTLAFISYNPEFYVGAYPVIGVNILGAALFALLGCGKHRVLLKMPGAYLMAGTALLSWIGVS